MPADAILRATRLAKDEPTGLHFTDRLRNVYAGNPEIPPEAITIWFIDAPSDTQFIHNQQTAQEDVKNTNINTFTNNTDVDHDSITIRITGVTDEENNNNNENENTIINSEWDNNNLIENDDYGYVDTADDIKQTWVGSQDDNIRPAGVTTTDHDIETTGLEDQTTPLQTESEIDADPNETEEQYEYVNLQGVFEDIYQMKLLKR